MNVVVNALGAQADVELPVEVVERKGLGHPDTLCDALAEEVSLALSRFYRGRFGFVLHHNVDKVLLRGGSARAAFGGGEMHTPIEVYLAGRATREFGGVNIPVERLAIDACTSWLSTHMHALDPERHVRVHCLIRPGSTELAELFERDRRTGRARRANDTAIGVGWAPRSTLERAVLAAEASLHEDAAPERGEDTKVLGVRVGTRSTLTVACAFVGGHLQDLDAYLVARSRAAECVRRAATDILGTAPAVHINTADDPAAGSVYLTVTGTSAEAGDDGEAGRGNRANGLITPTRPMVIESFAGKNPITHVGKLYNVAATRIANALVSDVEGVAEAQVLLVSQIGAPIDEPQLVELRLRAATPGQLAAVTPRATEIARHHLQEIGSLWELLLLHNLAIDGIAGL